MADNYFGGIFPALGKGTVHFFKDVKSGIVDPGLDLLYGPRAPKVVQAKRGLGEQEQPAAEEQGTEMNPLSWTQTGTSQGWNEGSGEGGSRPGPWPYTSQPRVRQPVAPFPQPQSRGQQLQQPPFPMPMMPRGNGFAAMPGRANAALSNFFGTNVGAMGGAMMNRMFNGSHLGEDVWSPERYAALNQEMLKNYGLAENLSPEHQALEALKALGPMAAYFPQSQAAYQHFVSQLGAPTGGSIGQTSGVGTPGTASTNGHVTTDEQQAVGAPNSSGEAGGAGRAFLEGTLPGAAAMLPWLFAGGGPWGMAAKVAGTAILPYLAQQGINWLDPNAGQTAAAHPIAYGAGAATGAVGTKKAFGSRPTGATSPRTQPAGEQQNLNPAAAQTQQGVAPVETAAPAPTVRIPTQARASQGNPAVTPMGTPPIESSVPTGTAGYIPGAAPTMPYGGGTPYVEPPQMPYGQPQPTFAYQGQSLYGGSMPPVIPPEPAGVPNVPPLPQGAAPGMLSSYYPQSGPRVPIGTKGTSLNPEPTEEMIQRSLSDLIGQRGTAAQGIQTLGMTPEATRRMIQGNPNKYTVRSPWSHPEQWTWPSYMNPLP